MQTPHLWWGYNYSTCKNRYYFIEIRGGGGFVYNILSTKIVYKSVLPLHLPSKYSFYTLHREKKGVHLESEHPLLLCVLPLGGLDMLIADVELYILDEALDILLVAHRADK